MAETGWLEIPWGNLSACQGLSASRWQLDSQEGAVQKKASNNKATLRSPMPWAAKEY